MSYKAMADMKEDSDLRRRVAACVAQESGQTNPEDWVNARSWEIATTPGWADAWDSAVAGNIQNPGADAGVISDLMILSRIQQLLAQT